MNASSSAGGVFYLLLPAHPDEDPDGPCIEVLGRRWILNAGGDIPSREQAPEYTCVSYSWGPGREPHPFAGYPPSSDRTLAVIETVVRTQRPAALWVDAFCVPIERNARAECLSRMGEIYAAASKVVVVLSPPCSALLERIQSSEKVDERALLTLERDDWVTRVWTYHEVVNSGQVRFLAEGPRDDAVEAEDFLREVAYALDDFKEAHGYGSFELRAEHPRLDWMEELMLDWKMAGALERSAYQVMTGMHQRESTEAHDHFYAMFGAIAESPKERAELSALEPAESFMRLCEDKGDYSFLYTSAPRSTQAGRTWRPRAAERFHPVFPWHSHGAGQPATVHATHIELEGMWVMDRGALQSEAIAFTDRWLGARAEASSEESKPARVLRRLRSAGFTGCGQCVELVGGYFFSQEPLPEVPELCVAIATGLRMTLGAPALGLRRTGATSYDFCSVGLFFGPMRDEGETIDVAG